MEQVLGEIMHITGGPDPQNAEQPSPVHSGQRSRVCGPKRRNLLHDVMFYKTGRMKNYSNKLQEMPPEMVLMSCGCMKVSAALCHCQGMT